MSKEEITRPLTATALWPTHAAEGAGIMPLAGWQVAAHYGDPEAEYHAARVTVALMDVSFLTIVAATGADHIEYLNRRLSQRVIELPVGKRVRANQLGGDGRMEADFDVARIDQGKTLLIAPPAVAGPYLQQTCDKYVFNEDAQFTDETGEWALFALFGPTGSDILPPPGRENILPSQIDGVEVFTMASSFLPGATLVLAGAGKGKSLFAALLEKTREMGGRLLGFLPFDTIRIEAGCAWWGIDLTERSIPLEADLTDAIHTNKGCYPGQETIAKIMNLGHPARKLVGIQWETDDPPIANSGLQSGGAEAGILTSSSYSPRIGRAIGLGMVKWPFRAPGTEITTGSGFAGRVVALPFQ